MVIKVLGSGCTACKKLHSMVEDAVKNQKIDAQVEYVTDMAEITKTGVMQMPALVIDEKVVLSGRIPKPKELVQILTK